jgi:hypothetical protein
MDKFLTVLEEAAPLKPRQSNGPYPSYYPPRKYNNENNSDLIQSFFLLFGLDNMTTTVFSPPASCFTSVWASNTPLEGLVYVTVGCPAYDVTSVPASLSACCGPFSDYSGGGLLIATLTDCPGGYGPVSYHIATEPDPQFDFADFWCCPT